MKISSLAVLWCIILLVAVVSFVCCDPSPTSIVFGVRQPTAVDLFAKWKPGATQYTSLLYYRFCAKLPQGARALLGSITQVRFLHYTDHKQGVKYDQIHQLPDTAFDTNGCMEGSVSIHEPFQFQPDTDSFGLLLLTKQQTRQTDDMQVKYHMFSNDV